MQGPVELIALVTTDCRLLTGNVVYHLSRVSLLCRLSLPNLTLEVASSFRTVRCWWICSIRRDRSRLISIPRKQQTRLRSVIVYLARRRLAAGLLVRHSEPIAWNSRWPVGNRFDRLRWCLPRRRRSDHTRIVGDREI